MARPERQQAVLDILSGLKGLEPLKQLFWSELNYQRVNQPLFRRGWTESARGALADDPVLFAGGGENNDFYVIYARLASDKLLLGGERPVVSRLLNEHPYTLFVFSNAAQDRWHFLNVKYDETSDKRRLFRRITVGPEERLRTASERICLLSLESFGLAPLTIQQHHDEAFDVEAVTKKFFDDFCKTFTAVAKDIRERNKWMDGEAVERETQMLLNRLLFLYFIQRKGWMNRQRDYLRAFSDYMKQIPIPAAPSAERAAISALVQKCLEARGQGAGVAEWEAEINERVARLYGLTREEIKIVSASAEASPFAKATADKPARQGSAVK